MRHGSQRDGVILHISSFLGDGVRGGIATFVVDDVDALHAELLERGVAIDVAPTDRAGAFGRCMSKTPTVTAFVSARAPAPDSSAERAAEPRGAAQERWAFQASKRNRSEAHVPCGEVSSFTSRRASKDATSCWRSWESTRLEGMCLHQAPGQRRSEDPGDVGNPIDSRHEASLSATQ